MSSSHCFTKAETSKTLYECWPLAKTHHLIMSKKMLKPNVSIFKEFGLLHYSRFSRDVTPAMLLYRTTAQKSHLGIWFCYYAKLERHFAIVLYTNMAVSSCEWKPRTDHFQEPRLLSFYSCELSCLAFYLLMKERLELILFWYEAPCFSYVNDDVLMLICINLHNKSREVSI